MNGCVSKAASPWDLYGWQIDRCPLKLITPQTAEYLQAFRFFERGMLPADGTWLDQSAKFISAMDILSSEKIKVQQNQLSNE